jgi:hypothetical protein
MTESQVLLKVSPQRQITVPDRLYALMGRPSHVVARIVKKDLILQPALGLTLVEAERQMRKHGITSEVLEEALRIVDRKAKAARE